MPGTDVFGAEERKEVNDVLHTGALFRYNHEHLREGQWKARELEARMRKFTGAGFAHAVSSGSAAVSCALAAAGIGHGDEVIVPPFTYIATIEAVLLAGGLPVFAEIDETLCLSPEGIRKAISPNTKAVLLVHMCGAAADMDKIIQVCKEKDLLLVEDAGQALGAFYRGTSVGLFGKSGAFSFDFFKITTCGEGGVFVSNSVKAYKVADSYSDHGHDHIGNSRGMEKQLLLGFNYRISELHAAVGVAQMRKLNWIMAQKRRHKKFLKQQLSEVPGLTFRRIPDESGDSGTFLNFFLPDTNTAAKVMEQFLVMGLEGFNYWYTNRYHFINQWEHLKELRSAAPLAIHHFGAPQDYRKLELPNSQQVVGRLISLGIRANWTEEETLALADEMKKAIRKVM
ncbi:DegT/DnrJ/EryC1/StrS family aminotransferase [Xanthovirga aplysinae]|uniref:DegT/DnrJ/EryC1/StrS family aminotransferase n=1 Tax=Xanthovirga aplysinae TaxID=2529853 RepID=UPI0012BCD03D|nr:DegT/DnrJ/EryC1/StrS family aminotransferase [Xanthovirga aplysinae]MTI30350.1 DegT/DnrJ/EryC1/StrS family aminotransferase [Xanthovirga aplysinae]